MHQFSPHFSPLDLGFGGKWCVKYRSLSLCAQLLRGVTISQGGVLPHIPEVLLFKKSQLRGVSKPQSLHTKPATTAASKVRCTHTDTHSLSLYLSLSSPTLYLSLLSISLYNVSKKTSL